MDIEEMMCRYPEYFTKQGRYIWENGLEGFVHTHKVLKGFYNSAGTFPAFFRFCSLPIFCPFIISATAVVQLTQLRSIESILIFR